MFHHSLSNLKLGSLTRSFRANYHFVLIKDPLISLQNTVWISLHNRAPATESLLMLETVHSL